MKGDTSNIFFIVSFVAICAQAYLLKRTGFKPPKSLLRPLQLRGILFFVPVCLALSLFMFSWLDGRKVISRSPDVFAFGVLFVWALQFGYFLRSARQMGTRVGLIFFAVFPLGAVLAGHINGTSFGREIGIFAGWILMIISGALSYAVVSMETRQDAKGPL